MGTKKPGFDGLACVCAAVGFCWGLCRLRWHRDGIFRNSEVRCLGPSWGTLKGVAQEFIHELGHGNSAAFAFVVQGGDKEPGELRRIMTGSGHWVLLGERGFISEAAGGRSGCRQS